MAGKRDYLKRQTDILASLGLFYLIIIALFAVPLLGAFVVVLIQGVIDLRYAIIVGGGLAFILILALLIRWVRSRVNRIRRDGAAAGGAVRDGLSQGAPVQVSVLNGLLTLTYGGRQPGGPPMIDAGTDPDRPLLPHPDAAPDVITQLKELNALKEAGIISETEFETLKKRLIEGG
jgi:hypothetical protein